MRSSGHPLPVAHWERFGRETDDLWAVLLPVRHWTRGVWSFADAGAYDRAVTVDRSLLLSTVQMAHFAASGMLSFEGIVPGDINDVAIDELRTWGAQPFRRPTPASLTPLSQCYPAPAAIGSVLRLPAVMGIIESLVGSDPLFDHDFVHLRRPNDLIDQRLHADAILDPTMAFDIQLFYFPHAIAPGEGGTRYVPGTHLRRVNESDIARYQNVRGQRDFSGPAGTILVFHHGLWHSGRANPSSRDRVMYKVRLNPTVTQTRLWNTDDLDAVQSGPDDHIFARFDTTKVGHTLRIPEPWWEQASGRLEQRNRALLWRYLSGDDAFDVDYYLTRTENRMRLAGAFA